MFLLIQLSLILKYEFSVVFPRSKNVVVLYTDCPNTEITGKLIIEYGSVRLEEDFKLMNFAKSNFEQNLQEKPIIVFPADFEEKSRVSIPIFKQNMDIDKYTFYWRSQIIGLQKKYNCLNVRIIECISSVALDRYEGDDNCQRYLYLLTSNLLPVGYLGITFNQNSEQDLTVGIDSRWERETSIKRDFYIDVDSMGVIPIWDENHLYIQIGNENESKLNIINPGEQQIFLFPKVRAFYIPSVSYTKSEHYYILYLKNTANGREKFFKTNEILLSIFDKRLTQSRISSSRHLEILSPEDQKFFEGTINGIPEAKRVIVQIKGYLPFRIRDIRVIPVIYGNIRELNRQIVVSGSKENFAATLVLSRKPITSLTDFYTVIIKARPDAQRFQYCIKSVEKPCQFKNTDDLSSYQQVTLSLNIIEKLVLRCRTTEFTLSTTFPQKEITKLIDISGLNVEINIRRLLKDGMYFKYLSLCNIDAPPKWSEEDYKLLAKLPFMAKEERSIV